MRYGLDNSQVHKEPLSCHWCGNNLKGIRNVYKGKDCERYYCSEEHHKKGEEQAALRARAALRRGWDVVSSHYLVSAIALVMLTLAFIFSGGHRAWAHNPDTHQPDDLSSAYSEAYGICCSGHDYVRISTWEPTDTGYRIMYKGQWFDAPRSTKVKNIPNPDGEAKAWINGVEGAFYVRCFMPGMLM